MSAALPSRRLLLVAALSCFVVVFGAVVVFERPGLGVSRLFFVAIVLSGLATGLLFGAAGGLLAGVAYSAAVLLSRDLPDDSIVSAAMALRLGTYIGVGALIGFFAEQHRSVTDYLRILADRDKLTGLPTSRPFEQELSRRVDAGAPFALLLADVEALDGSDDAEKLQKLPGTLAPWLGPADAVARVGPRECAMLIGIRSSEEVAALAAVLETALAGQGLDVTFGWALAPRDGRNGLALYGAASDRLHARTVVRRRAVATA